MQNDYLRLPPHSLDAEQVLIGSLLQRNDIFDTIADVVTAEDFYNHNHKIIFREAVKLIEANRPADIITVLASLEAIGEDKNVGGISYLGELCKKTPTASNSRRYAEIVRDKRMARDLIAIAQQMTDLAYSSGEILPRLEEAQKLLSSLHEGSINEEPVTISEVLKEVIEDIDNKFHREDDIIGLSTGLLDLDERTNGLQKSDLIIIAGRPGMGKSALAFQIGQTVAINGKSVLAFSLEMSTKQLAERAIANIGKISHNAIRTGKLQGDDWTKLTHAVGKLHEAKLFIDKTTCPTIGQIRAKSRRMKRKHGLDLIILDYLQLMTGEGDNRNEQISGLTRGLKLIAKELNVPLIALSQLSRKVEERQNKRPVMSDLRDSGAIEQDADIIFFIYRDEFYSGEKCLNPGIAELDIAKFRNGQTGQIYLTWNGESYCFNNHAGHYRKADRNGYF
jgi:replicative DNA helicase